MNFTLLGAGYFCIPLKILQLFSEMQLPCLKQIDSFWSWFYDLLGHSIALLCLNYFLSIWQDVLEYSTEFLMNFSSLSYGNRLSGPVVSAWNCSLVFSDIFSLTSGSFLTHILMSLRLFWWTPAILISGYSDHTLSSSWSTHQATSGLPLSALQCGDSFKVVICNSHKASLVRSLSVSLFTFAWEALFLKLLFSVFCLFFF